MKGGSQVLRVAFLGLYIVTFNLALQIVRLLALVLPRFKQQWELRRFSSAHFYKLKAQRDNASRAVLFFCSSAGEYEQAKPLIDRLQAHPKCLCVIVFFSVSGLIYATAKAESATCILMPTDSPKFWRQIFQIIRPALTIVVRHELWPGFLSVARSESHLILINGTDDSRGKPLRNFIKGSLLKFFHQIAVVSRDDQQAFERLGVSKDLIAVTGDTKFDRVVERAFANSDAAQHMRSRLEEQCKASYRLIIGSAWEPEITLALAAYKRIIANDSAPAWQLVIAPHKVDEQMIQWIFAYCRDQGLRAFRFSELDAVPAGLSQPPVVIVDKVGFLSELYASGQLAFVGGGMGGKIHNVLEPASYGAFVAIGPNFLNSKEAVLLEQEGFLEVVTTEEQLWSWWTKHQHQHVNQRNVLLLNRIQALAGAADRLMQQFPFNATSY